MGASSVTGVSGPGTSGKATTNELSKWANGPVILISDVVSTVTPPPVSPPSSPPADPPTSAVVLFPTPLEGTSDSYCVMLTPINGVGAAITEFINYDLDGDAVDDHFVGFELQTNDECDVMYLVVKKGYRAI